MPYTLKPNKIYARDPNSGGYLPQNVVADTTTAELVAQLQSEGTTQVSRVQAKADEVTAQLASAGEMEGMLAGAFSTSTNYTAGQYVIQTVSNVNKLYRFIADHPAGAWTGTDVVEVKIGGDVADLKSALMTEDRRVNGICGETNYGYDEPYELAIGSTASKAMSVKRSLQTVILDSNSTATSQAFVVKLNNDVQRASTTAQIKALSNGTVFTSGHTYRVTLKKISGTYSGSTSLPLTVVYKSGTDSTVGTVITDTSTEYCREFTADGSTYMIGIRCQSGSTAGNLMVSVTMQDMSDKSVYDLIDDFSDRINKSLGLQASNATTMSAGANIDQYIAPGNYKVESNTIASQIAGTMPVQTAGRLIVMTLAAESRVYQIYIRQDLSTKIYVRFATVSDVSDPTTASWTEWKQLINEENLEETLESVYDLIDENLGLKARNITTIPTGSNVDQYITPGNYKVESNTIATGITGLPVPNAGRLTVMTLAAESRVYQIYIRQDLSTKIYVRYATVSDISDPSTASWTTWKQLINDENLEDRLKTVISRNTKPGYYLLDSSDYAVGWIGSSGNYSQSITYRVCTPKLQTALTDIDIYPREGYRLTVRLFSGDEVTDTISPNDVITPVHLTKGQQFKLTIRRAGETSSDPDATVAEMQDKAMFYNPAQKVQNIGLTGDTEYVDSDFGLVPCGIYYPGIASEQYNTFDYDTTASEVIAAFDALVSANSNYITKTNLGVCSDGEQHVYLYDFNPHQPTGPSIYGGIPTIYLLGGQHGYEKASVYGLYYMFKHMINNSSDNPVLNYLRNHIRILCIPLANPYGFNEKIYKNANGVNLNRNWDTEAWGTGEGEDDPDSKDYAGTAPFSEKETQYARNVYNTYKDDIIFAIDYHTNGKVPISTPDEYNAILYSNKMPPIWQCFKKAIRYHIKDITSHFNAQYSLGLADNVFAGSTISSVLHGGSAKDWVEEKRGKMACTFETFPGFIGDESAYSANVMKASEELIANFIITVMNYIKSA